MENLTLDDFLPYLHQQFAIAMQDGEAYVLELAQVEAHGAPYQPGQRQPFSLLFRSARTDAYLPQGVYVLEHAQMGTLEIFIVPLGPDADGMRYEAIFS